MALRTLTYTLAAATLTVGASAQAAGPVPARASSSVEGADHLSGNTGFLAVAVFMLAVLSLGAGGVLYASLARREAETKLEILSRVQSQRNQLREVLARAKGGIIEGEATEVEA